jgi:cytochrome c biogenesis protein CcdA
MITKNDSLSFAVGTVTTLSFCGLVYLLVFHAIPVDNRDLANIIFGILAAKFGDVVGFFFGSSRDAAVANSRMSAATPSANPNVAQVSADAENATQKEQQQ